MKKGIAYAAAGLLLASFAASAQGGIYVGVGIGPSTSDIGRQELDDLVIDAIEGAGGAVLSSESSLDDSDIAFSGFIGYRFGDYFAIEGAYVDLGAAEYEAGGQVSLPGAGTGPLSTTVSTGANGPALSALGIWPLSQQWELFVRGGVFFASVSADLSVTAGTDSFGSTISDSSEELFYGVGAAFRFREGWAARAEFTQYSNIGDSDIGVLSVGLTWSY